MQMIRSGFCLTVVLTLLTGLVYPLAMTAVAQVVFPKQANGSLLEKDGKLVGSLLIGQGFSQDHYFIGRPSAAGENGYDATASGGSNLGPNSEKLMTAIKDKVSEVRAQNDLAKEATIPADLATSSGSGLDPDISLDGAYLQIDRVAAKRGLAPGQVRKLVDSLAKGPQFGLLGETRVNVLELNLALDSIQAGNQVK
ncbi:potassium-transporting ATPase subunit KdpC [Azotosporobacter soli]|uniref:potassium-transporting ATPase subunit KdpC n=1 Tax=Azotosporobacter soli TaxID=3055040 RepID=UPI0031FECDAD